MNAKGHLFHRCKDSTETCEDLNFYSKDVRIQKRMTDAKNINSIDVWIGLRITKLQHIYPMDGKTEMGKSEETAKIAEKINFIDNRVKRDWTVKESSMILNKGQTKQVTLK